MSNNLLIAVRMCGEIDGDGGASDYGSEEGNEEERNANEVASG